MRLPALILLLASRFALVDGDCVKSWELVEGTPAIAMHSYDLSEFTSPTKWLCITTNCTSCTLIVEVMRICESDGNPKEPCPGTLPYILNDDWPELDDCVMSIKENFKYQRCRLLYNQSLKTFWVSSGGETDDMKLRSGFSVRVDKWTNKDDLDYRFEVLDITQGLLLMNADAMEKSLFVTITMPINRLKHLNRIESGNPKCSYDLYYGGMINRDFDNFQKILLHINDSQPLFEAPLESSTYTITIPHGCAPNIEVSLDEKADWMNITQTVCAGSLFLVTPSLWGWAANVDPDYYMQRFVTCPDHLIDIQLFTEVYNEGNLTIVFFDAEQKLIPKDTVVLNGFRLFPLNKKIRGVSGALFQWHATLVLAIGFDMSVVVTKSASVQTTKQTTTRKLTTTSKRLTTTVAGATSATTLTTTTRTSPSSIPPKTLKTSSVSDRIMTSTGVDHTITETVATMTSPLTTSGNSKIVTTGTTKSTMVSTKAATTSPIESFDTTTTTMSTSTKTTTDTTILTTTSTSDRLMTSTMSTKATTTPAVTTSAGTSNKIMSTTSRTTTSTLTTKGRTTARNVSTVEGTSIMTTTPFTTTITSSTARIVKLLFSIYLLVYSIVVD